MLNPKNSYKAYSKTDVNTSDQLTLIIMLYDGLLRFLKKAMVKIEENDVEAAHNYFVRSKDIVNELLSTLHAEKGGDIGNNLRELYLYMFRRIVEANLKKDIEITKDVYQVAKTLHEGWIQLKSHQQNKEKPNKGSEHLNMDAKSEYTKQLVNTLKPQMYDGIKSIYDDAKEIYKSVIYFLKNPELIRKQLNDCSKTLDGIRSKTSSADEASSILLKYLS